MTEPEVALGRLLGILSLDSLDDRNIQAVALLAFLLEAEAVKYGPQRGKLPHQGHEELHLWSVHFAGFAI